jgi:hypothetical protein
VASASLRSSQSALNNPLLNHGERILLTLWVGGLWIIGYLAVPILFASLDDRIMAGMLAGKMFTALSYLGLFCGGLLLVKALFTTSRPFASWTVRLLLVMLLIVVVGEFWIQPIMAELKIGGLVEGSEKAARFGKLHGVASSLYLINSLCGLALLLMSPREIRAGE